MKLKLSATIVMLSLLSSCGGGGDTGEIFEAPVVDVNPSEPRDNNTNNQPPPTNAILSENRNRPSRGVFSSSSVGVVSNGTNLFSDDGNPPQRVAPDRVVSWPGLRFGDFLVSNNPWNASKAQFPLWFQEISLFENNGAYGVTFDWDWGAESDTNGSIFETKSFPEVIYGTKSAFERSGSFAQTGLPVEIFDAPVFTVDYDFDFQGRRSDSATTGGTDSEFNVVIESFYHSSCDVQRSGNQATDNTVFEAMVWLKLDERTPSGKAPVGTYTTSDGKVFDVHAKSDNFNYIAFVAQQETLSGTIMYTELLDHAKDFAAQYGVYQLLDTDCLANILVGTEIWHGGGTFNLNEVQINRAY